MPSPIPPELKTDAPVQIAILPVKESDVHTLVVRYQGIDVVVSDTKTGEQRLETICTTSGSFAMTGLTDTKQKMIMTLNVPDGFLWQIRFKVREPAGTVFFKDGRRENIFIPSGAQTGQKLFALEGPIETRETHAAKLLIEGEHVVWKKLCRHYGGEDTET